MNRPAPTVYLFYGDDELAIDDIIQTMREKLGDPTTADLNTRRFSANEIDLGLLEESCKAIPFLSHRRLTIIENAERLSVDPEWRARFHEFLESLPASAALVLIEDTTYYREKKQDYITSSDLYQWAQEHPEISFIQAHYVPRSGAFVKWLQERCQSLGGEIDLPAAQLLADWVAEDPLLSIQELAKLLDYVDRQRPIQRQDVEGLTPYRGQENIFAMVDALGQRESQQAQERLHKLLEDEEVRYVFAMVVRQFRLLILAREALNIGKMPKEALPAKTPDFVVRKISAQARNFTSSELDSIYHKLLEIDLAEKTSRLDKVVALDSFIADLCS
ncbi:MAG: DNA polymerase III subunit delta [Anaerolineales bacterium]|nr:DNA polymerase III subunit delta [Anaerolineales bacterium]